MQLPKHMHPSWWEHLEYTSPILDWIYKKLTNSPSLCPGDGNVFRAFSLPLQQVKVIMLGQDPYPSLADAKGVAFAVEEERLYKDYPFSLKILSDAVTDDADKYFDPTLQLWMNQGVLLLNAALTCRVKEPRSHEELWRPFMVEVFKLLNRQDKLIFIFFGKVAEELAAFIDDTKHVVITCPHPAALAYGNKIDKTVFKSTFEQIATQYEQLYSSKLYWVLPF